MKEKGGRMRWIGLAAAGVVTVLSASVANEVNTTAGIAVDTATYFETNADGSLDLTLRPCSFAFLELEAKQ